MSPAASPSEDAQGSSADPFDASPNAADGSSLRSAAADADNSAGDGNVGAPESGCVSKHWIKISLVRAPDLQPRPDWWPPAQTGPYASEQYNADLTNGSKAGALDGEGAVNATGIPAGTCEFQGSKQFYDEIEQFFDAQLGNSGGDGSGEEVPSDANGQADSSDSNSS